MEHLEPKEQWYLLQGKIIHLRGETVKLRERIMRIAADISIDNLGISAENPHIQPEIVDNAILLESLSRKIIDIQEEFRQANTQVVKVRDAHYKQTGELLG